MSSEADFRFVWIDCEMTGLAVGKDKIIEIAAIITDKDLVPLDGEGFERVIHCDESIMNEMDEWCTEHHRDSGLTARVAASTHTTEQVEQELLQYIKTHVPQGTGYLSGNSVHVDKEFMQLEFPQVTDYLHYRIIDVSSIKMLSKIWTPELKAASPAKKYEHRALEDIRESIMELKYYKEHLWKVGAPEDNKNLREERDPFERKAERTIMGKKGQ